MERTRLLLDPWSSDYNGSVQTDDNSVPSGGEVDATVETERWVSLPPGEAVDRAWFVDGVRRIEARTIAWHNGQIVHGAFATFATGAVSVSSGRAIFYACRTERKLVLTHGLSRSESLRVGNVDLAFEALSTGASGPADVILAFQVAMRNAEATLAGTLNSGVIFLDGPLTYVTAQSSAAVGVVKTMHSIYLEPARMDLVFRLNTGERTPIFSIRDGNTNRYSWYLRIAPGRSVDHRLSGIIRLESQGTKGIDAAVALADKTAAFLPRLASTPARDARAPQNLTPVGALEQHLRNQMGDTTLIKRAIERRISEGLLL